MKFTIRDLFWAVLVVALALCFLTTWVRNSQLRTELELLKVNLELATSQRARAEYQLSHNAELKARLDEFEKRGHLLEALSSNLSEVVRLLDSENTPKQLRDYKYRITWGRDALDEVLGGRKD